MPRVRRHNERRARHAPRVHCLVLRRARLAPRVRRHCVWRARHAPRVRRLLFKREHNAPRVERHADRRARDAPRVHRLVLWRARDAPRVNRLVLWRARDAPRVNRLVLTRARLAPRVRRRSVWRARDVPRVRGDVVLRRITLPRYRVTLYRVREERNEGDETSSGERESFLGKGETFVSERSAASWDRITISASSENQLGFRARTNALIALPSTWLASEASRPAVSRKGRTSAPTKMRVGSISISSKPAAASNRW